MSSPFFMEGIIPEIYALLAPAVQPISSFCHASNKYLVTLTVNEKLLLKRDIMMTALS